MNDKLVSVEVVHNNFTYVFEAMVPPGGDVEIWCYDIEDLDPLFVTDKMPSTDELKTWAEGYIIGREAGKNYGESVGEYKIKNELRKTVGSILNILDFPSHSIS